MLVLYDVDFLYGIGGTKYGASCDEYVCPCTVELCGIVTANASIDFDACGSSFLDDALFETTQTAVGAFDEFLSAESGIDGHEHDDVGILKYVIEGAK